MVDKIKNPKVVIYSILAILFIILTYTLDWVFILGAVILVFLNQKDLIGKKNN